MEVLILQNRLPVVRSKWAAQIERAKIGPGGWQFSQPRPRLQPGRGEHARRPPFWATESDQDRLFRRKSERAAGPVSRVGPRWCSWPGRGVGLHAAATWATLCCCVQGPRAACSQGWAARGAALGRAAGCSLGSAGQFWRLDRGSLNCWPEWTVWQVLLFIVIQKRFE
jgi:hypothetical protein